MGNAQGYPPIDIGGPDDLAGVIDEIEHERRRIGHELHDVLGHELAVLIMKIRRLRAMPEMSDSLSARLLVSLEEDVTGIIGSLRQVLNGLIPLELDESQFLPQLRTYARSLCNNTGLACTLDADGDVFIADERMRLQLLRIIQEAVHNAMVHACCNEIRIRLFARGHGLEVEISDNGVGYDSSGDRTSPGHGRNIMAYRASLLGATLDVVSSPGQGTSVRCRVPAQFLHPRTH